MSRSYSLALIAIMIIDNREKIATAIPVKCFQNRLLIVFDTH